MSIPKNWKPCTDTKAQVIFSEIIAEAKRRGYNYNGSDLMVYTKNTTAYGECRSQPTTKPTLPHYYSWIGVHKSVLNNYRVLTEVLVHEIAHSFVPELHHNRIWKTIGDDIGSKFGVSVRPTASTDYYESKGVVITPTAQYIVQCPQCGSRWEYFRMCKSVKDPAAFRCGKCGSALTRVK